MPPIKGFNYVTETADYTMPNGSKVRLARNDVYIVDHEGVEKLVKGSVEAYPYDGSPEANELQLEEGQADDYAIGMFYYSEVDSKIPEGEEEREWDVYQVGGSSEYQDIDASKPFATVDWVEVEGLFTRNGLATAMMEFARTNSIPIYHDKTRTPDGTFFAEAVQSSSQIIEDDLGTEKEEPHPLGELIFQEATPEQKQESIRKRIKSDDNLKTENWNSPDYGEMRRITETGEYRTAFGERFKLFRNDLWRGGKLSGGIIEAFKYEDTWIDDSEYFAEGEAVGTVYYSEVSSEELPNGSKRWKIDRVGGKSKNVDVDVSNAFATIDGINVNKDYQRRGIATAILEFARTNSEMPIYHSYNLTDDGVKFAGTVQSSKTTEEDDLGGDSSVRPYELADVKPRPRQFGYNEWSGKFRRFNDYTPGFLAQYGESNQILSSVNETERIQADGRTGTAFYMNYTDSDRNVMDIQERIKNEPGYPTIPLEELLETAKGLPWFNNQGGVSLADIKPRNMPELTYLTLYRWNNNGEESKTKDYLERENAFVQQKLNDHIMPSGQRVGDVLDGIAADSLAELKEIADKEDVSLFMPAGRLKKMIADGRFKTAYEVNRNNKGGSRQFYLDARESAEYQMGVPETLKDADRPIYGLLGDFGYMPDYGNTKIIFKNGIKNRTTATLGDSLDGGSGAYWLSDLSEQKYTAKDFWKKSGGNVHFNAFNEFSEQFDYEPIPNAGDSRVVGYTVKQPVDNLAWAGHRYIETQIHGGVTLDDVAGIVLANPSALPAATRKMLAEKGIDITFDPMLSAQDRIQQDILNNPPVQKKKIEIPPLVAESDIDPARSPEALALAEMLRKKAEAMEPEITEIMVGLAEEFDGDLDQLEQRLKSTDGLARKIMSEAEKEHKGDLDMAAEKVSDSVRYTMTVDGSRYTESVPEVVKRFEEMGYQVRVKNFWESGDPYQGINMKLTKNGVTVEFQMHTPESLQIKVDQLHSIYEEYREINAEENPDQLGRKTLLWEQMIAIANTIPNPDGYEDLLKIGDLVQQEFKLVG